jgi:uncharacterized membrane protein YecN with MAPEG domain
MIVTPIYAGILAILFFVLSIRVVALRRYGASLGDGGDAPLQRRIRGHGNFAEYVPLILVMMAMLELSRYSTYLLHGLGVTLVVARLLHAYALSFTERFTFGRFWGTALTYAVMNICGVLCIYQGIQASVRLASL